MRAETPIYLFSTFPGFDGRKPPADDGNGVGRGAPNAGAAVGDGVGRGVKGCVGQGTVGAAVGIGNGAGFATGAGAVNGATGTGFGTATSLTAGFAAIVLAFDLVCLPALLLNFLADFFAAVRFCAADLPFFLRSKIARFDFFTFDFDFFALLFDLLFSFRAMIAS